MPSPMNTVPLVQQRIPVTSRALYISGIQALNLRENGITQDGMVAALPRKASKCQHEWCIGH